MKRLEERRFVERFFESALWHMRWAIIVAVSSSLVAALLMFYIAGVDTFYLLGDVSHYAATADLTERGELRSASVTQVVEVIDIFLLAIVLVIFGMGIYELYISKVDHAYKECREASRHLLSINNLDDLKTRLGKVIMMILIVKFFELAIGMEVDDTTGLMMMAGGVFLCAAALMFTERTRPPAEDATGQQNDKT